MYNIYPNQCKNYVDLVTEGICPYDSDSRNHISLWSCDNKRNEDSYHYLSDKKLYYKSLYIKFMEIEWVKYA
jgi:hypothetical protein